MQRVQKLIPRDKDKSYNKTNDNYRRNYSRMIPFSLSFLVLRQRIHKLNHPTKNVKCATEQTTTISEVTIAYTNESQARKNEECARAQNDNYKLNDNSLTSFTPPF